ncbi:hypothetical protein JHK82_050652 [Glycine max]|nr:hypothetical protein JHK85_051366 [Glycine max]KAG5091874.1 hypothetical protein JHK82_050652 [Glycine max]KAG5094973.1 hypothetical protein JHK84_050561 [Glycine max]
MGLLSYSDNFLDDFQLERFDHMELPASLPNFDFCGYNERHRPAGSGLLFVIGVIPGKEISSAVVPDKHGALEQLMVTKANVRMETRMEAMEKAKEENRD